MDEATLSPDGNLLASASSDGTMKLWEISLFADPYAALCTDIGRPARQDWGKYAPGRPPPRSGLTPRQAGLTFCD